MKPVRRARRSRSAPRHSRSCESTPSPRTARALPPYLCEASLGRRCSTTFSAFLGPSSTHRAATFVHKHKSQQLHISFALEQAQARGRSTHLAASAQRRDAGASSTCFRLPKGNTHSPHRRRHNYILTLHVMGLTAPPPSAYRRVTQHIFNSTQLTKFMVLRRSSRTTTWARCTRPLPPWRRPSPW